MRTASDCLPNERLLTNLNRSGSPMGAKQRWRNWRRIWAFHMVGSVDSAVFYRLVHGYLGARLSTLAIAGRRHHRRLVPNLAWDGSNAPAKTGSRLVALAGNCHRLCRAADHRRLSIPSFRDQSHFPRQQGLFALGSVQYVNSTGIGSGRSPSGHIFASPFYFAQARRQGVVEKPNDT